jgi:hypothetical protein
MVFGQVYYLKIGKKMFAKEILGYVGSSKTATIHLVDS